MKLLLFLATASVSLLVCSAGIRDRDDDITARDYTEEYCEKLKAKCERGRCSRCCEEYEVGCTIDVSEEEDSDESKDDSTDTVLDVIKKVNERIIGDDGLRALSESVLLANGTRILLHSMDELKQVAEMIKDLISDEAGLQDSSDEDTDITPFFASDIILTPEQAREIYRDANPSSESSEGRSRQKRHYGSQSHSYIKQWPSNTVYYTMDAKIARNRRSRRVVRSAAQYWSDNTCVNFVEGAPQGCTSGYVDGSTYDQAQGQTHGTGHTYDSVGGDASYVDQSVGSSSAHGSSTCDTNQVVVSGLGGCASNVGYIGGTQGIHLGNGCQNFGVASRQFGHTLGAVDTPTYAAPEVDYTPEVVPQATTAPSFNQVRQVNQRYCPNACATHPNHCLNNGYPHPRNCQQCVCPLSHTGTRCQYECLAPQTTCVRQPCQCVIKPPEPTPGPQPQCRLSHWSSWSRCSVTCGGGLQTRTRHVVGDSTACGTDTRALTHEQRACSMRQCSTDCVVSHWGAWSGCQATCGRGCVERRFRRIIQDATHGGRQCGQLSQSRTRSLPPCRRDCIPGEWGAWSGCHVTCGHGCVERRSRRPVQHATHGGRPCQLTQTRTRALPACSRDCIPGQWGAWSGCHVTCGHGCVERRSRRPVQHATHGGRPCQLTQSRTRTLPACPIQCQVPQWSRWSQCAETCGYCERVRQRQPVGGAEACSGYNTFERTRSYLGNCPVQPEFRRAPDYQVKPAPVQPRRTYVARPRYYYKPRYGCRPCYARCPTYRQNYRTRQSCQYYHH